MPRQIEEVLDVVLSELLGQARASRPAPADSLADPSMGGAAESTHTQGDGHNHGGSEWVGGTGTGGGGGGLNPDAIGGWSERAQEKYGVHSMGQYRSPAEQAKRGGTSDHVGGYAVDLGGKPEQMAAVANRAVNDPDVKYVIYNRQIWQPGKGWKPYSGKSPHTDHVHVSFKRAG